MGEDMSEEETVLGCGAVHVRLWESRPLLSGEKSLFLQRASRAVTQSSGREMEGSERWDSGGRGGGERDLFGGERNGSGKVKQSSLPLAFVRWCGGAVVR